MGKKLSGLSSLGLISLVSCGGESPRQPVNIIYIMTDDHAFQAISAYGHPVSRIAETPNIDRIAQNGVLFNCAYVENSISAPSRATLLTGMYSHQHGQTHLGYGLDPERRFFTEYLQDAGYTTAVIGKWHLNVEPKGFDFYKILNDQGEYYNPYFKTSESDGKYVQEHGYATDLITDSAISWLDTLSGDEPFCLLMHHKAPHRNWMPDLKYLDLYEDVTFPEPVTLFDDHETRGEQMKTHELSVAEHLGYAFDFKVAQLQDEPTLQYIHDSFNIAMSTMNEEQLAVWNASYDRKNEEFLKNRPEGDDLVRWKYQRYIKDYCRTIKSVDDSVGRLLDYLEEHDMLDNTIVVYTSDQGFFLGEHGLYDKRFMYEEAFRTPLIISFPGGRKGEKCNRLVQNVDYAPTLLSAAGLDVPEDMAGMSLLPLLCDEDAEWRNSLYYHFYDYPSVGLARKHDGVRTERYKLIHFYGKGYENDGDIDFWELYDLEKDPTEVNNIYEDKAYRDIRAELHEELVRYRSELNVQE